jgi:CHAD domain-containing protein
VTAGTTTTEQEAKFDVDEGYDPPDLRPLIGRTLLDKLHAAIEATPFVRGAPVRPDAGVWESDSRSSAALPAFVYERWRKLKRKARKGGSRASDSDLHQIRIAAMCLRHASETAVPVIGKPARRTAKAAERAQTFLGEFHDAVAAERWLRAQVTTLGPEAGFAAGVLSCEQQRRQQQFRRQWRAEWKKLRRRKNRSWL